MRIRQIALVARELEPAVAALVDVFDIAVGYRDPGVGQFGLENAVMPIGDTFLEVVSPVLADTTAGRFLARRGDSGYMVIFETSQLAEDRTRVEALGARVVWEVVLNDISTIHLHPRDTGGAIVSLDQPNPAGEWRWGGPEWRAYARTHRVRRIVSAEVEARDPGTMAAHWSVLLALPKPSEDGGARRVALRDGGELRFVPAGPRGEGVSGFGVEASDPEAILAAARARGLPVRGRSIEVSGVRVDLVDSATRAPSREA
jgi:hypothetical protein